MEKKRVLQTIEKRKGERKQKGRRRQWNKETSEARRREERKVEI